MAAVACIFLFVPEPAHAVLINGVDFTTVYNANVVPNSATPQWSFVTGGAGPGTGTVSGGILTISTTALETRAYQIENTSIWDGSTATGSTIEFSLKVNSMASGAARANSIFFTTGPRRYLFNFTPTEINANGTNAVAFDTTSAFNVYRIVLFSDQTTSLSINGGAPVISGFAGGTIATDNRIRFGDASNSAGGVVEWNYVAFTNAVPEPGTVGLLLLGIGTLACRRMRRRTTC